MTNIDLGRSKAAAAAASAAAQEAARAHDLAVRHAKRNKCIIDAATLRTANRVANLKRNKEVLVRYTTLCSSMRMRAS
jgi:hypothetical protein